MLWAIFFCVGGCVLLLALWFFLKKESPEVEEKVLVIYATQRGTSRQLAQEFVKSARQNRECLLKDASSQEDLWQMLFGKEVVDVVLLLSEYGSVPLVDDLVEHSTDFRVGSALEGHRYSVLGLGSSAYDEFCSTAKKADKALRKLGATRVAAAYLDDTKECRDVYEKWRERTKSALSKKFVAPKRKGVPSAAAPAPSVEIEDLTGAAGADMVTSRQAKNLKKEGYKLIGSHSAVKMCRWTKHQLRGRGGCYKHTFYGITSYQCMECTPSLACANKCVFCWRHHTNPVGKEWKWTTDDPVEIVEQAIGLHVGMIKEAKGVPGVLKDRWEAAHTVKHCALSLVGEPIMYPRINEMLNELHARHISSFLVTNAQFPEAIDRLVPVTQLYVSVDAPNEKALVEVDRPLFKDAWRRLNQSLSLLRNKKQRTVARLTIVKGYNESDAEGYANLCRGVTLVEIKGVTFCGKSDASDLTMESCPWFHEIVDFAKRLADLLGPVYEIACAHQHSVSVLIARTDQLKINDKWHTWIDYDKFNRLVTSGQDFGVEDYVAETPSWALYQSEEKGFDPQDTRVYKKKANGKSR